MCTVKYSLGHRLLCAVSLEELHRGSSGCCRAGATLTSWLYYMRLYYGCCYSCCVSQEWGRVMAAVPAWRENVSAVPTAPRVSFQPFSSHFAHPGSPSSVERVNSISRTSAQLFSCVWLFVTPWTVACQASLSMGFPRQEDWSGLPLSSPDLLYVCVY